jgi:hypothetical protein
MADFHRGNHRRIGRYARKHGDHGGDGEDFGCARYQRDH